MCGIVSIVRPAGLRDAERGSLLTAMRDALAHRGPDDATAEIVDGWAALAFRRLSIIDLEGARQPLHGETDDVLCVFNGEIYNFQDLRARLEALGHRFTTRGDGEVITHGYEQWGDAILDRLEGMFSFVLVDRRRARILAARDRAGIKPLFWTEIPGGLLLASELKALLLHPEVRRVASGPGLDLGLVRMHVPWPLTAFDGVYRLPPGAALSFDRASAAPLVRRFAPIAPAAPQRAPSVPPPALDASASSAPPDLLDRAEHEVHRAVARQMVADVPVGAFLSGGIDSTLLVTLMRRLSGEPLHTFSIGVDRADDDESEVARDTASRLGTIHHELRLDTLAFEDLAELPALYDEPFAETSALGVRALSRAAREHVKVVLTGDGGDEVFGGYDTYRMVAASALARRALPRSLADRLGKAALTALGRGAPDEHTRRALRLAALVGMDAPAAHRSLLSTLAWCEGAPALAATERLSELVAARAAGPLAAGAHAAPGARSPLSATLTEALRAALVADRLERLPGAMLTKVDIASMSASIEVRVPLLDDALVRFADALPVSALVSPGRGKLLTRRLLERLLPGGPAWHKKRGFALPIDAWIRSAHAPLEALFHAHRRVLRDLTRVDATAALDDLLRGSPRYSAPTAGMRLLWLATVALWSDRHRVTQRSDSADLDALVV
ncbi:asparagine synthase (glutamine-hydrolyzing) [Chondromyces crocatus]|uniref:asparagine synthase (glutamine-hydrolyzing) n=1 Tax=Chondromyces crocatus TaxID=52 RepID=A0A0K1EA45_CHOCO|nr:asparagine synthase (glutamine-hydrolyzing) [Chondromyces crocatus]AKT37552.1 asparagine synthase [Chondromyces crocatus]